MAVFSFTSSFWAWKSVVISSTLFRMMSRAVSNDPLIVLTLSITRPTSVDDNDDDSDDVDDDSDDVQVEDTTCALTSREKQLQD